jgi:hypothetical protein
MHPVDRAGLLQAQIAELDAELKAVKKEIVALGEDSVEGDLFRATVSVSERKTLDMEAVREKLTTQFITAHTKVTEVTTVRLTAKIDGKTKVQVAS